MSEPNISPEQAQATLNRIRRIVTVMDSQFRVPGTNWRFGLDPILGVLLGAGDAASGIISAWMIYEARKLGLSNHTTARMVVNVVLDVVIGGIPLLGDAFDFYFKANRRNLDLLEQELQAYVAEKKGPGN